MFALLGDIPLGLSPLTAPTGSGVGRAVDYAEHPVVRGTPVLQDMGDALGARRLDFFFDEAWCEPADELAKLEAAIAARTPMSLVAGNGGGRPLAYVARALDVTHLKTTAAGQPTRIEATLTLTEAPIPAGLAFGTAPALITRALVNPLTER